MLCLLIFVTEGICHLLYSFRVQLIILCKNNHYNKWWMGLLFPLLTSLLKSFFDSNLQNHMLVSSKEYEKLSACLSLLCYYLLQTIDDCLSNPWEDQMIWCKKKRKKKRGYREQKGIFDHKDYQIQGKVSVELFGLDFDLESKRPILTQPNLNPLIQWNLPWSGKEILW